MEFTCEAPEGGGGGEGISEKASSPQGKKGGYGKEGGGEGFRLRILSPILPSFHPRWRGMEQEGKSQGSFVIRRTVRL